MTFFYDESWFIRFDDNGKWSWNSYYKMILDAAEAIKKKANDQPFVNPLTEQIKINIAGLRQCVQDALFTPEEREEIRSKLTKIRRLLLLTQNAPTGKDKIPIPLSTTLAVDDQASDYAWVLQMYAHDAPLAAKTKSSIIDALSEIKQQFWRVTGAIEK